MLPSMFGIGGSEILVILVVALLFLGPDKLPEAAKTISKGIRDLRKQTRDLQHTIESDTEIGGAIRDLKSALRGEDIKPRPRPAPSAAAGEVTAGEAAAVTAAAAGDAPAPSAGEGAASVEPIPTLPASAGESDAGDASGSDDDLRGLVRPAADAVAKGSAAPAIHPGDPGDDLGSDAGAGRSTGT